MHIINQNLKAGSYEKCIEVAHQKIQDTHLDGYMTVLRKAFMIHYGHSVDVSRYSHIIGNAIGASEKDLEDLVFASLIHDIGKTSIPKVILEKPGRLNKVEFDCIKGHTSISKRILETAGVEEKIVDIAYSHHEKLSGTGYPRGLKGNEINELTQIVTVSDIYSALREQRAYKEGKTHEEAISILRSDAQGVNQEFVSILNEVMVKQLKKASGF